MIEEAEKELEKVSKTYTESKQNLITAVRSLYQEVLEGETNAANRLKASERASDQLKIDQSKYAAGLLSSFRHYAGRKQFGKRRGKLRISSCQFGHKEDAV